MNKGLTETIREAAHEVQLPVFYAIAIIITAYLPIFTLEHVEGRLFHPMAWTVAFALLGAIVFAIILAPVLASYFFRGQTHEWHNPVLELVTRAYRRTIEWTLRHRALTLGSGVAIVAATFVLVGKRGLIGQIPSPSGRRRHMGTRHVGSQHRPRAKSSAS